MNFRNKYPPKTHTSSLSGSGPIMEKNVDDTPYIDLLRWGVVFFREQDPFRNKKFAVGNKPSSFLDDAKTTKGERIYHTKYVKYFFDRIDKNSPTSHDLIKIGERVENPIIKERENVNLKKYYCKNLPENLKYKEFSYIKNVFDDYHSLSLPF